MKSRTVRIALIAALGLLPVVAAFAQLPKGDSGTPAAPSGAIEPKSGERAITILVPDEGEFFVRFLKSANAEPVELPFRFTDKRTTVKVPAGLGKSGRIAIDDGNTGNTAIVPIPAKDSLDLHRLDFDYVHRVEVKVNFEGNPVKVAEVNLTAKDKSPRHRTIDASAQGTAVFRDVPVGSAMMSVVYGDNKSETRTLDISTDHPAGALVINCAVTNKVPTIPAPPAASTTPSTGAPVAPAQPIPGIQPGTPATGHEGSGFAGVVGDILALLVAGGVIFLLYRWAQSGGMAATLKKAGIEVSGPSAPSAAGTPWQPNAPAPPVVSDPSLCPFCGQKKDGAGNCACTLSGAALATGPHSPAIPIQPRLVGTVGVYSGTIFPLAGNGSGVSLGRETTNTIPLPNDTTVSRRHACIRVESGSYILSDEGSSNGVFVNGAKIAGAQALRPGDELQIGNTRFRFEV